MPAERAGYTLVVYAVDVSPSMGAEVADPGSGEHKTKLDLAKEYVARKIEPKISSGRKTEAVGIVSFGGRTNNQANRSFVADNPDEEDPPFAAVSCDVAVQTAKPKTLEVLVNLHLGTQEGNPVSAVMVALDMIHTHKHTKSWAVEIVLVTDGESAFRQDDFEDAMGRIEDQGVQLSVVGIGFQQPGVPQDKTKTRNKRLSEKFWNVFVQQLTERIAPNVASDDVLPTLEVFDDALLDARFPRPAVVNGTVSGIELHIGSPDIDPEQAIVIPIKYSKATMKARPPTLSKAWKAAMELQAPLKPDDASQRPSQLAHSVAEQSQTLDYPPVQSDLAAMVSAEVKNFSTYVIKRQPGGEPGASQLEPTQGTQATQGDPSQPDTTQAEPEPEEEEPVAREDIVKAYRFGSTWVPMEKDTFEPLDTKKGVEILGFFPREAIKRHLLMGEVRFVWPDLTSPKAQIKFSSLVEGMALRDMVAVVRWVLKDQGEPVIGLCVPEMDYPGEDKRLDYMFWVKMPFAEDEHNFWFPSLTTYKTSTGKTVTEHPLLPTEKQCELMDELVDALDLDEYAEKERVTVKEERDDDDMGEEAVDQGPARWFEVSKSFNPVIHRIKEAVFHASLTEDLEADPLGPPHPEIVKYFNTPAGLAKGAEDVTHRLKESLNIKKVPPKQRRKVEKEELRPDEGYIDIDDLFSGEPEGSNGVKAEPSSFKVKTEEDYGVMPPPDAPAAKPKPGRLVSNEKPLQDFKRLIEGEGDVFRKAIQDLGAVVKENVEASFSRQAFPLALECLHEMRRTALEYEEDETYNEYLDNLQAFVNAPGFKHKEFWSEVEKDAKLGKISAEEAKAALEGSN